MSQKVIPACDPPPLGAILLVGNYSNRTGYAWNNIFRLFEAVAARFSLDGHSVLVSFAKFEAPLDWQNADSIDGIIELPPIPRTPTQLRQWVRAIRLYRIETIYLTDQGFWALRYLIFRLAGVSRIITHCRISVADPNPAQSPSGLLRWTKWCLARLPLICVDKCYAVSDFVRDRLVKKAQCPASRVVTILNGIDLDRFSPSSASQHASKISIFCCGRATRHKGVQVLIQAAALLRDHHNFFDFEVLYAGDGPDLDEFKRYVSKLDLMGHFLFLGQVQSTDSLIRSADIVVVPSIWGDACPSSVSEAMAAGKPLVATRVGGVPELVGDDMSALMTEPGSAAELAAALSTLCRDSHYRHEIGARARKRAEQALDQRRYHEQVIRQLRRDLMPKVAPTDAHRS